MSEQQQEQGASVETAAGKPAAEAQSAAGEYVEVFVRPEDMQATAQALLDAAGEDVESVQTISGGFWIPEAIATAAGISATDDRSVDPERTGDLEAREGSGAVVSADDVIADAIASGQVSPQAVGAVFASNSPTGQDEPEVATGQQELPDQTEQTGQAGQAEEQATEPTPTEQSEPGQVEEQETPAETGQQEEESAGEAETRSAPTAKSRRRASEPRATSGDGR
jgi:hypothetical protein